MSEQVIVVKSTATRRRAVEGSLGMLAGIVFACLNGPWLLSLLYTPPSGDALSCGPTVSNALGYFVRLQVLFGIGGSVLLLLASFFVRRALRRRREAGDAPT